MKATDLIAALDLPASTRVDQRVPKKLLVENGAPTAADKRLINDGIEEIHWLAVLKPANVGVPEYRDAAHEYLEIAVLSVIISPKADTGTRAGRLAELVHRAVPYPAFLILAHDKILNLSLAHKRWAQNEAGKMVLEDGIVDVALDKQVTASTYDTQFMEALALGCQPRTTLYALYQGWIDTFQALHAARRTGTFVAKATPEQATARRDALHDCQRLEIEITRLRNAASKEKQLVRQVELNLALKRAEAQLDAAREKL